MNRNRLRAGALLLLTASSGILASSCQDPFDLEVPALFVRSCLVEPADTCEVGADVSWPFLSQGTFDSSFGNDYACPLLIGNQDAWPIQITGADVRILDVDGSPVASVASSSSPTSGFVERQTADIPGFGLARVRLLDVKTADELLASNASGVTLIAAVRVHGTTLEGREVSSDEWLFPIKLVPHQGLCNLAPCLSEDPSSDVPPQNCHPGVDSLTDCRQGCGCTVGKGECAPLACVDSSPGSSKPICLPCRVDKSDCAAPAQCVPYPSKGSQTGRCE